MERFSLSEASLVNKIGSTTTKELYRFCVSDDRINRNGYKILTAGIQLDNFKGNPVFLFQHNRDRILGKVVNIFSEAGKLYADFWFHCETDESRLCKKLVDMGVISMTSIGANVLKRGTPIPIANEDRDKYPVWKQSIDVFVETELLEISLVTIPANTGAGFKEKLQNSLNSNIINQSEKIEMERILAGTAGAELQTINKLYNSNSKYGVSCFMDELESELDSIKDLDKKEQFVASLKNFATSSAKEEDKLRIQHFCAMYERAISSERKQLTLLEQGNAARVKVGLAPIIIR